MQTFPLFLNLHGRRALVVGGGDPAARKVELLLAAGAQVSLIAATVEGEIAQLIGEARISWARPQLRRGRTRRRVAGHRGDGGRGAAGARFPGRAASLPAGQCRRPACAFELHHAGDRRSRTHHHRHLERRHGARPGAPHSRRDRTQPAGSPGPPGTLRRDLPRASPPHARGAARARRFWDRVFESRIGELALAGDEIGARRELIRLLDGVRHETPQAGMVHLVGAGPGDPDLLTLKAHRLLQCADVVVYDRLVSAEVLAMARRDAERVYVGKRRANHCVPQDEINDRLVAMARAGKSVVRLKGGDPFVFGRGGEEVEALVEAGVAVEVVPGITAALGCAATAGIPLTHRDHAQACVFVTGHLKDGSVDLDWQTLARPRQTVVIYMGVNALSMISSQLVAHGLPLSTPVALIENGTTDRERRVVGTLSNIERQANKAGLDGPTLCVVGEVVGLAHSRDREIRFESRVGL